MAIVDLVTWLDEYTGPQYIWFVKRLSGNDTLANGSHQAGPYIPKPVLFKMFPSMNQPNAKNPRVPFDLYIDSHPDVRKAYAIWYNNRFENKGGKRNEARLTNLGGRNSALLDPESTGAITVFVFIPDEKTGSSECHVWVTRDEIEEELVEERIGAIEPDSSGKIWTINQASQPGLLMELKQPSTPCWLSTDELPLDWLTHFPSGIDIVKKTLSLCPDNGVNPDVRLMQRRECEFELFRSLEEAIELPGIKKGFNDINEFIAYAQTILQRRKTRSGRSLELHVREIFIEEGLAEDVNFSYQVETENGQKPDFIFPSKTAYKDPDRSVSKLAMLAVKTTCKDRWRQILREADRIENKHLLTLQEGISEAQFREMTRAGVKLVVPAKIHKFYARSIQPDLQTFESFLADIRLISL